MYQFPSGLISLSLCSQDVSKKALPSMTTRAVLFLFFVGLEISIVFRFMSLAVVTY